MLRSPAFFGALLATLAVTQVGRAAGHPVIVLEPGSKTCVARSDLEGALVRAGLEIDKNLAGGSDTVTLLVEGTPSELHVSIHGGTLEATQRLGAATCETATDVVAAFVASALAPAPDVHVEPEATTKQPIDPNALDSALRAELARRNIQLAMAHVRLSVGRDATGWTARITKPNEPGCDRMLGLGNFDELTPRAVGAGADAIADVVREFDDCPKGNRTLPLRAAYLERAVDEANEHERRLRSPWLFVFDGALFGTLFTISALKSPTATDAVALSSAGWLLAGGITATLVNDDYVVPVERVAVFGGVGGLALASATDPGRYMEPAASIAIASGMLSSMVLVAVGAAARRPPVTRLKTDHKLIATEDDRESVSLQEVRRIENDLRDLDPPIPDWITYAPVVLGGLAAAAPAIASGFSDTHKNDGAWIGLPLAIIGGFAMIHHSYYNEYRQSLENANFPDIAFGPGPGDLGGVSLSGRF